jgi:hypothetical protein
MRDNTTNATFREKMKGYTDLRTTASQETVQIA